MAEEDIRSYIDQASNINIGTSALCLSGGEVLIYYDLLRRTIMYASAKFKYISIITNAFWATTEDIAYHKSMELKRLGLNTLVVSTSPFHSRYIPTSRVRFAVVGAHKAGLRVFVKVTSAKNTATTTDLINAIRPLPQEVEIDEMTFLPGGRASQLSPLSFDSKAATTRAVIDSSSGRIWI
jgi:hypothetical protein